MTKENEEKYSVLADVEETYKSWWEKLEYLDYKSKLLGDPEELEAELEMLYTIRDEFARIVNNAGIIIPAKWFEENREAIRRRVDSELEAKK